MIRVHHDFETYSEVDIKKTGGYRYAMDPSTEVLMLSWAVNKNRPEIWVPAEGEPMPVDLLELITDPEVEWHAFNAQFERLIWWHILGHHIPTAQFHCTMQLAWSLSFSGGLAQVGEQVGLSQDHRKLKDGAKLIQKFCKPAPRNHKADRYGPDNAPEEWARFKSYCKQDVIAEREIDHLLSAYPIPPQERELWLWDQDINDRGVPIDLNLVNHAVSLDAKAKAAAREELNSTTFLDNGASPQQLLPWLAERGLVLPNCQAETLRQARKTLDLADPNQEHLARVLDLRLQVSKTSAAKWQGFKHATGEDGLLRGMFQFAGAQRTQRWAGRTVQLHNLKSPANPEMAPQLAELLFTSLDFINAVYGNPLDLLSEVVRCAITAPDGYMLAPVDLGSIESRVLGYMAGCARINATFAAGKDTYKDFATEYYGLAYEAVTKPQRKFCKPPVLGCGYRLGWKGLIVYAEGMGVVMSEEDAKLAVKTWRKMNPEVVDMWSWFDEATADVVENWTVHEGYCVRIHRDKNFLMIDLPSGRSLHYYAPLVLNKTPPWAMDRVEEAMEEWDQEQSAIPAEERDPGEREAYMANLIAQEEKRPTVTYLGMNQYTRKWDRLQTHGGKITENIDQAISRDILAFHMLEIERQLGPIIRGHVHDEAIPLVPEHQAEQYLRIMEGTMRIPPPWAPTLLLGAKGFITKRYTKD